MIAFLNSNFGNKRECKPKNREILGVFKRQFKKFHFPEWLTKASKNGLCHKSNENTGKKQLKWLLKIDKIDFKTKIIIKDK